MQQYLTLEEAAKYLQMPPDELREMAKKKTVRAFQDRGTWRFRSQDIEELARTRGLSSDVDLQLGEAAKPQPGDSKRPSKKPTDSDLLPADFSLDESEEVPLGQEKRGSGSKSGRSPKPGSDSDVRLVMDGDLDPRADAGKSGVGKKHKVDSGARLVPSAGDTTDSDVRLEPSGKDSGTSKKGSKSPSDSDIRLHEAEAKKKADAGQVTEEIDLDAEEARLKDQPRKKPGKPTQMASKTQLPGASPFELSEPDMEVPPKKGDKPKADKPAAKKNEVDSSSDFELIPFDASKSPVELGSGEIPLLQGGEEDVDLGSAVSGPNAGASGINLKDPADSGISLEDGGSDEIEFELSLDEDNTPKPSARSATRHPGPPTSKGQKPPQPKGKDSQKGKDAKKGKDSQKGKGAQKAKEKSDEDSSSEFELSLEDSSPTDNSSSEFELSLEDESPTADSSSEFELSLEDSSGESSPTRKLKAESPSDSEFELTLDDEGGLGVDEEAGDIFEETNFDVPALEDESGSEAVAIDESDTDLEGSDFEISLDEDSSADSDSDSQVVALEDEEADEGAATVARPRKTASKSKAGLKDDAADLELDLDDDAPKARKAKAAAVEEEEDEEFDDEGAAPAGAVAAEQDWGALPAVMLFPTVLVMFLVAIMGFELLRGMFGYHRATAVGKPVIDLIARNVDDSLPK
ncbi:MAG: helix-turn-helix domain-containing protein [Gemmataceae bacterium]